MSFGNGEGEGVGFATARGRDWPSVRQFNVFLENRIGQRQPQGMEFFVAAGCLFITFAFPGFVWRYLRRGGGT